MGGSGGGLIFLTGPNFNPRASGGTPLEPLLPVVPDLMRPKKSAAQRAPEPFQLQLTRQGEGSAYLQMDPNPDETSASGGVPRRAWTAPVSRREAGAEVLLVDPRPSEWDATACSGLRHAGLRLRLVRYFGTNETYRWRSRTGEKVLLHFVGTDHADALAPTAGRGVVAPRNSRRIARNTPWATGVVIAGKPTRKATRRSSCRRSTGH